MTHGMSPKTDSIRNLSGGSFSQKSNIPMSSEVLSGTSRKAEQAFPLFDS